MSDLMDEARSKRVAEVGAQVAAGTYRPDSEDIAQGILEEMASLQATRAHLELAPRQTQLDIATPEAAPPLKNAQLR